MLFKSCEPKQRKALVDTYTTRSATRSLFGETKLWYGTVWCGGKHKSHHRDALAVRSETGGKTRTRSGINAGAQNGRQNSDSVRREERSPVFEGFVLLSHGHSRTRET
eukprot:jgi/Psemu1/66580/estExt_Genemark1.C_2190022